MILGVLVAATALTAFQHTVRPVEADAIRLIREVSAAAKKQDFSALRKLMVDDFTYSFGGDRNADQAIERWKEEKRQLPEIVRVLRQGCRRFDYFKVVCPGNGDMSYRGGFRKTPDGWRFEFFVEGD